MLYILSLFQKKLSIFVPLFMGGGFILGLILKDPSVMGSFILPLTFLMVYPMMVTMPFRKILEKGNGRVQWAALIINFGVIPFIALLISRIFFADNPYLTMGILLVSLLLLYGVNIIISTVAARLFFNRGDGLALVYGTVLRNLSIALAIAMTTFGKEGSQIALIIALGYIIQIQLSAWYVKLSPRFFGEYEEDKGYKTA